MVVRDPGPPGFAAASDAAEPPSTSTVTSWSKEAAGPCPPSLHSGREEEERVVRGGARPSGVGYSASASSAARTPQLFTSHRPELGPVATPSVRGGRRACSSFWAAAWLAEVRVLIAREGEMGPGRQPVVPAAEDGGDSGLEPSIQRPWRWTGVEGWGGLSRGCPGRERKGGAGPTGFCQLGVRELAGAEITPALEPCERGAGGASGYSEGLAGGGEGVQG